MKTVHKYPLPVQDFPTALPLPAGSVVRHVAAQDGQVCVWVEKPLDHDPLPTVHRRFAVVGTGVFIQDAWIYLGTVHVNPFVWHVYEVL